MGGHQVKTEPLGLYITYVRGVTYRKSDEINSMNGTMILRSNNIDYTSNSINLEKVKYISKSVKVRNDQRLKPNDILISTASGSIKHVGKVAYIKESSDCSFGAFMAVLRTNEMLNSRFLFHVLSSSKFLKYLNDTIASSTINNLSSSIVNKFKIPIPPLKLQKHIVSILDEFYTLANDFSIGIPAEQKARRKQYEYYRNELLTFKNQGGGNLY